MEMFPVEREEIHTNVKILKEDVKLFCSNFRLFVNCSGLKKS